MEKFDVMSCGQPCPIITNPTLCMAPELIRGKIAYDSVHGMPELKGSEVVDFEREMEASLRGNGLGTAN